MNEPSFLDIVGWVVACMLGVGIGMFLVVTAVRLFGSPPSPPRPPSCEPGYVYLSRDRVCVQGYRAYPR